MKNKISSVLLGVVSLFVAGVVNAATVSVNPLSQNVTIGDSVAVSIVGSGFPDPGVTGGSITLNWDPAVLQLDTTITDTQIDGLLNTGFSDVISFDDTISGQLDFTALVGITAPPAGELGAAFDFLNLTFTALAPPGTNLAIGLGPLGNWQLGDFSELASGDVSYISGSVIVAGAGAVPVPAAVWLFGSGFLGLIGVARRRKV